MTTEYEKVANDKPGLQILQSSVVCSPKYSSCALPEPRLHDKWLDCLSDVEFHLQLSGMCT